MADTPQPAKLTMLPEWTVIGFSGHRNLATPQVAADAISQALDRLAANRRPLVSVSSAASGADTLFVEAVARQNLPYLLVLPFSQSRFQQDFDSADWQRILPLIEQAARVDELAGGGSSSEAYMETGVLTVDRADVMVVVWDGKPAAGLGGTGDVVNYTRALGKPLLIVDPHDGHITEERMDRLPEIRTPMEEFEPSRATVEKHFQELDQEAEIHAPGTRHLTLRIILFQLLAAAIGFVALAFEIHGAWGHVLTLGELILLGWAAGLSWQHRKKHHEWMKNRIAAEICRSFLATWQMRRIDFFPHVSIEGVSRLCRNLRLIRILDKTPLLSLAAARDQYLRERVQNQAEYFSRHSRRARMIHKWLSRCALFCTTTATVLSLVAFVFALLRDVDSERAISGLAETIPKYLSLLLPLVATGIFTVLITHDYSRRAVRYREMALMLEEAEARLQMAPTWNSLARIALETEEKLLQEIVEWHSFRQFVGEPR
jgi:hypothetical protein